MAKLEIYKTEDVTHGEQMQIARGREGLRQVDVADCMGVTVSVVRAWERDVGGPRRFRLGLTLGEWVTLQRKRCGLTLRQVAKAVGRSVMWCHRVEQGTRVPTEAVMAWWEQQVRQAERRRYGSDYRRKKRTRLWRQIHQGAAPGIPPVP